MAASATAVEFLYGDGGEGFGGEAAEGGGAGAGVGSEADGELVRGTGISELILRLCQGAYILPCA